MTPSTRKYDGKGWDREVRREPTAEEVARVWRGYGKEAALERWRSFGERFLSDLEKSVPGSTQAIPQRRMHTPEKEAEISGYCAAHGFKKTQELYGVEAGYLGNLMRRTNAKPPDTRTKALPVPVAPAPRPVLVDLVVDEVLVGATPARKKPGRTIQLDLFREAAE